MPSESHRKFLTEASMTYQKTLEDSPAEEHSFGDVHDAFGNLITDATMSAGMGFWVRSRRRRAAGQGRRSRSQLRVHHPAEDRRECARYPPPSSTSSAEVLTAPQRPLHLPLLGGAPVLGLAAERW